MKAKGTKPNIRTASLNTQCGFPGHESRWGEGREVKLSPDRRRTSGRRRCSSAAASYASSSLTGAPADATRPRPQTLASPWPASAVPVARLLLLLLRPRDASSPLPEAAIWGGAARGVRPWKLREASGRRRGEPGERPAVKKKLGLGGGGRGGDGEVRSLHH